MAKVEFKEATTSLDPYTFDDELIPFSALCCTVYSCFLKTPDCWGAHGKDENCCILTEFSCCKPGRNEKEYVVLEDALCAIVKPTHCCKGARQCFCLDCRTSFLDFTAEKKPFDPNFPCLCTVMGATCFYNWEFMFHCCAKISTIKSSKGTPITK